MRISENFTDWKSYCIHDIQVAENELLQKNFRSDPGSVLCDIYVLPANNHQTFFARVVSERGFYKVIHAKAIQNSIWFHDPIYMYTFDEAKRFEDHPMRKGRIVCRAGLIDKKFVDTVINTVNELAEQQPENAVEVSGDPSHAAKLIFTGIRVYKGGLRRVYYTDAEKLVFAESSESKDRSEQVKFLSNLYLMIERIIGIGG